MFYKEKKKAIIIKTQFFSASTGFPKLLLQLLFLKQNNSAELLPVMSDNIKEQFLMVHILNYFSEQNI